MGLLEDCRACFQTDSLYEVLGAKQSDTSAQIKKSFYKQSLKYHPDRARGNGPDATLKFQTLNKAYNYLLDKENRKVYDETGVVDDESDPILNENFDFLNYWRNIFPKITRKDIEDFSVKYKHSADEKEDIKKLYVKFEGDMDLIMESLMLAEIEEESRYRQIINEMIEAEEVPAFKIFTDEPKKKAAARKRRYEKEAKDAKAMEGGNSLADLEAAILARHRDRARQNDTFLANLEAKYSKPTKKPKK